MTADRKTVSYTAVLVRIDGLTDQDHDCLLGQLVAMDPALVNEAIDRVVEARARRSARP